MIDGLKPYPEYRDIGLPWLQRVPAHWKLVRAKTVLRPIDVRSSTGDEELLTVSSERGVIPRRSTTVTMFKAESYVGHKLCWPGDLVINSLWAWGRGLGVTRHHGIVSTAYGVYRPRHEHDVSSEWLHELVRSIPFQWELQVRSRGVWISRLQLTDVSFLDAPLPVPPVEEQALIVRFIDHADRLIRRYISAKQKLIKLLEDERQAIIRHVVMRGLDPDAAVRASGVEWIADVPRHWDVRQVRRLSSLVTSGSRGWAEFYSDAGSIFLQSGNLGRSMRLNLTRVQRVAVPPGAEGERTLVRKGDVLVCVTGALTGNVALVDSDLADSAFVNQHVALVRPNEVVVYPRYLAFALHSDIGRDQFKTGEYGGTKQGLGLMDVKSAFVPLPPLSEQVAICHELDSRLADLTRAKERAAGEIDLVREFRTRLIADVVTGKLDVRAAAAALPDDDGEAEGFSDGSEDDLDQADATDDPEHEQAA